VQKLATGLGSVIVIGNVAVFSIGLQCTGLLSTDVDIRIQLNVSRASNVIILDIRRKKACLRGTRSCVLCVVVDQLDKR